MNGPELRQIRESLRMTQGSLAERLGVTQGRISQVEASDAEVDPAWTLAVEMVALSSGRLPSLDHVVAVGRLVYAAQPFLHAIEGLLTGLDGCRPIRQRDHALYREAVEVRRGYLALQLVELYDHERNGLDSTSTLTLIRAISEQTDGIFWVATRYHHLLYRGLHRYLTGDVDLTDELPEIVSITSEIITIPDADELLLVDRRRRWTVDVRGYGRTFGGDLVQQFTIDRNPSDSEDSVKAAIYAGHFSDIANNRAED